MTRDTVAWETPALTATSAMPILPVADLLTIVVPSLALRPEVPRVPLPWRYAAVQVAALSPWLVDSI
jgi:hypothetical protein